jgi:hypothetical protein
MGRVHETMRMVNSTIRTLLFAVLLAGAGFAGWKGYTLVHEPQQKLTQKQAELDSAREQLDSKRQELSEKAAQLVTRTEELTTTQADLKTKAEQVERLETSIQLLKLRHRIARLHVLKQEKDPETERPMTTVEFYEVNDEGEPVENRRREFTVEGDRVYVECLVAKFEDKYIEQSDLERSTAVCLFQRIFGEYQQPLEGFVLDEIGRSPTSYARGGKMSDFEQTIWKDFWSLANDPKKAAEMGIRAAHADAPSMQMHAGKTYELQLRATGEFTLKPVDDEL